MGRSIEVHDHKKSSGGKKRWSKR
jgi:hypothetical protein